MADMLSGSAYVHFVSRTITISASSDSQRVHISISWATASQLTCSRHFRLSASAYFHSISSSHSWHVSAIFDYQAVRSISISWAALSQLIYSRYFQLSAGAYFHFKRSTIVVDMSLPLSTLSGCVFPFHEVHCHGWHVSASFDCSESVYFYFMNSTIISDMFPPFSIISKCVSPFHKQHSHGWHVPTSFNYQLVWIFISLEASSQLTYPHLYRLSQLVRISILWVAQWSLIYSRHIQLSGSAYFHFIRGTIIADIIPPHSITRKCVFQFHELHHHGWSFGFHQCCFGYKSKWHPF